MRSYNMTWFVIFLLSVTTFRVSSINRPVYKIALNQKGYAQFLQYDIETPPLREFTFCTWFRIFDLSGDQSIFTYIANSNNRVVRLWLDSGGQQMKVAIGGRATSSATVDLMKDVWRHVCLSYQSDYGAWALYLDARLLSCEMAQSLQGYVLPKGGSVIVGYGTNENGVQNGLEGEIFGANMFLVSTIEKNYTMKSNPQYRQKHFKRNKIRTLPENGIKYVVLRDLQAGEIKHNFEMTQFPDTPNATTSFIKFRTPHSYIEHDVGVHLTSTKLPVATSDDSEEKEILDFPTTNAGQTLETSKFWNLDLYSHTGKFKIPLKVNSEPTGFKTQDLLTLSEYETPPPVSSQTSFKTTYNTDNPPPSKSIYQLNTKPSEPQRTLINKLKKEISEYETPPPIDTNTKVYGQWTSSKFASSVLNHLKTIPLYSKDQKKIPPTIPLTKISDSFPYASDFKIAKLRATPQFQRKKIVERRFDTIKRSPQINVQILEEDLRNNILRSHAQTHPKHVEIMNRGITNQHMQHRFYRNVNNQEFESSIDSTDIVYKPKPFSINKIRDMNSDLDIHSNLINILPFLKSLEYFTESSQPTESKNKIKSYNTRSLSSANKWHNVKSYSNDYTPHKISADTVDGSSGLEEAIASANKKHPSIRLKYKYENRKQVPNEDETILKGRKLAMSVSNQSEHSKDSVSILKYNHGYLPGHNIPQKINITNTFITTTRPHTLNAKKSTNFNKHVKIGNALNERQVIGINEEQEKRSFVGGDDSVPDIQRYRSDIDNEFHTDVPSSLNLRVCKNVDMYDHVLYVQPDESIDVTHIFSPVKAKNLGIEFIMQNYKKCSLEESNLQRNEMLFIDWSKTPVRLFGGAYPVKTTDLCGFF